MLKEKRLTKPNEIKIFSNPFRLKILSLFNYTSTPLTVKQISDKLKETSPKTHYHVKELEKIGVLELVYTKENGGIIEKYYLPTAENFKIDTSVKTSKTNFYGNSDDLIQILVNNLENDLTFFREHVDEKEDSGRLFSQLDAYLTPMETRELHDMIMNYLKEKTKKENSILYNCTFFSVKKYE